MQHRRMSRANHRDGAEQSRSLCEMSNGSDIKMNLNDHQHVV